jgi:hypothetical protein
MIYNGTNITITLHANHNLSSPTTTRIYYKKPNGETGFWTATMVGNDQLTYVTLDNDIDVPGVWVLQGYVLKAGTDYWTSLAQMVVEAHL